MISEKLISKALEFGYSEIAKYGLPTKLHFDLSLAKCKELSSLKNADQNLSLLGVILMDIKLGQAFKEGRLDEHVAMGIEAAKDFLADYSEVNLKEREILINCIEAHHGAVKFIALESQICTDADCYRFIHPIGLISYIATLGKRDLDFPKLIDQAEFKLEEKWAIISIEETKKELEPHYKAFKALFTSTRSSF